MAFGDARLAAGLPTERSAVKRYVDHIHGGIQEGMGCPVMRRCLWPAPFSMSSRMLARRPREERRSLDRVYRKTKANRALELGYSSPKR